MYSLRKSRHILRDHVKWYEKHKDSLDQPVRKKIEGTLQELDQASLARERKRSDELAKELEKSGILRSRKGFIHYLFEIVMALAVALAIATVVRQMWFEPYKIPTGSMRPTFLEQDHLVVSKTAFGLNIPLRTGHFYFDPDLVKRGCVVIWSGEGIDLPDTDTVYFWLFPGKKRYVKRCLGKPGDSLYFYGGRLFGVDKEGKEITQELQAKELQALDYVPMSSFTGRVQSQQTGRNASIYRIVLKHFNNPLGRFALSSYGIREAELYVEGKWVKEDLAAQLAPHEKPVAYAEFLGMNHYAKARLVTEQELKAFTPVQTKDLPKAPLYLELHHHPNLTNPRVGQTQRGAFHVYLEPQVTALPLAEKEIVALMDTMYTSRFTVQNGFASAWSIDGTELHTASPEFPGVPDGTYEFYYGKGYRVGWGGWRTELAQDHPLYARTPENVQRLFNLGIEVETDFAPFSHQQIAFPSRYAYYRDGDLYVMGGKVVDKEDSALKTFVEKEQLREEKSKPEAPYIAFIDRGPPFKDGKLDADKIRTFGVTVPEGHYLLLGDNHARSADSRTFGFVPQANIEGTPLFLIWPPGPRLGIPPIPMPPWITLPRIFVWTIALCLLAVWFLRDRKLMRTPLFPRAGS